MQVNMLRSLDANEIVKTSAKLQQRISERFPGSGLCRVAGELHKISQECVVRSGKIRQPNLLLRTGIFVLVCAILALLAFSIISLRKTGDVFELMNFVQFLESALGSLVFIGAAILFLVTLEIRLKRARALEAVHELRAVAHIIDMHQMTKDPENIVRGPSTPSSPQRTMTPFLLCRYLDYCTEMLSITSKVGALYVQGFPDSVALEAVDQVENLTNGLARKIWQKIMILDRMLEESGTSEAESVLPSATAAVDGTGGQAHVAQ